MSTSKLMTKASSLGRRMLSRNERSDLLFHIEDAHLAAAGIDQDAQRKREIGFGLEVFDGLRLAVLEEVEVVFGEVGNQRAMLVFDVEEQLDDFDVDLEGLDGLVLRLVVGAGIGWTWEGLVGVAGRIWAGARSGGVGAFCAAASAAHRANDEPESANTAAARQRFAM